MESAPVGFDPRLEKREAVAGIVYLPFHMVAIPLLLSALGGELAPWQANLLYYGLGVLFLAVCMLPFLRRQFDALWASPGRAAGTAALGILLYLGLNWALGALLSAFGVTAASNPNNSEILSLAGTDERVVRALALFVAPVLEEVLFRGVAFGAAYRKSRLFAYILSIFLFSVCHLWQYAVAYGDWTLVWYALEYIPITFVLCWSYEKSGTLWVPILLHMLNNALAYWAAG